MSDVVNRVLTVEATIPEGVTLDQWRVRNEGSNLKSRLARWIQKLVTFVI